MQQKLLLPRCQRKWIYVLQSIHSSFPQLRQADATGHMRAAFRAAADTRRSPAPVAEENEIFLSERTVALGSHSLSSMGAGDAGAADRGTRRGPMPGCPRCPPRAHGRSPLLARAEHVQGGAG